MTKLLRISGELSLPLEVVTEAVGIVATRNAGKSYTSVVLIEEAHDAGVQCVVIDPTGVYHGLRSSHSGKADGLPVYVFGGQHGDLPLEATAGRLMADVVVDSGHSFVFDLSDFSKTDSRKFAAAFLDRLFDRKARVRTTLMLVIDEADEFAPQLTRGRTASGDVANSISAMERVAKRGRSRGLGIVMIAQRTQALNKDVLDLVDTMIAMRITAPRSRRTVEEWLQVKEADDDLGVIGSLSSLPTGTAWVWSPVRGLLERVKVRQIRTFDSYRTPKPGEIVVEPKKRKAIDLAELGEQMRSTVEKVKAEDPTELRRQLSAARKELENEKRAHAAHTEGLEARAAAIAAAQEPETIEIPVFTDDQLSELQRELAFIGELGVGLVADLDSRLADLHDLHGRIRSELQRAVTVLEKHSAGEGRTSAPAPSARTREAGKEAGRSESGLRRPESPGPVAPPRARPGSSDPTGDSDFRPSSSQQRILNALAQLQTMGIDPADKTQLALFAEASPKSSTYTNNLGALRTAGLLDYPAPGMVALTGAGAAIADSTQAPTSTAELHAYVRRLVGGTKWRLLQVLVDAGPETPIEKSELAERAGASAASSTFTNNLGNLRTFGLIDYPSPGWVIVQPVLFLED